MIVKAQMVLLMMLRATLSIGRVHREHQTQWTCPLTILAPWYRHHFQALVDWLTE